LKCLSLTQPYADRGGGKTIETRRWSTNFRGKFFLHSSKAIGRMTCTLLNIDSSNLIKGTVIGVAYLSYLKKYTSKEAFLADKAGHLSDNFSNAKYGFLLKDAKKLNEPIPLLGRLEFFEVSQKIIIDA
jgi:hypothetical protein